jgi:hypothetical protein
MSRKLASGIVSAVSWLVVLTMAALAEDTIDYKTVGDWDIRVDRTLNYGCFMLGSYQRGEVVRIGFDRQSQNGYLMLGNPAWQSIEAGKVYRLTLKFGDQNPWEGDASAMAMGTGNFLYLKFQDANVLKEFAVQPTLLVTYKDRMVADLPLTGTVEAVNALAQCQLDIENLRQNSAPSSSDPFADDSISSSPDPFSH